MVRWCPNPPVELKHLNRSLIWSVREHHRSSTFPVRTVLCLEVALITDPISITVFYGDDQEAKDKLVADVKRCCLHNGFFQITGHSVPRALQQKAFQCSKRFFDLPLDEKNKVGKGT